MARKTAFFGNLRMPQSPAERDAGTWGALFGLAVVVVGLLGLIALVTPHLLGIALVIAGLISFGSLHYLIWGWWLGRHLRGKASGDQIDSPP